MIRENLGLSGRDAREEKKHMKNFEGMTKDQMWSTALLTKDLPGIQAGSYVAIVKYHDYNDTFSIRANGVLHAMVSRDNLTRFCL
jgi:hypothetical protein